MKTPYTLHTIEEWNEFTHKIPSATYGLIIFKFSPRCPISRGVQRSFDSWYEQLPDETPLLCVEIDVVNSQALSQHIVEEFGIRHESPQAIWITADRDILWHASHRSINSEALETQLGKIRNPKSEIRNPD